MLRMARKGFLADITPRNRKKYVDKLFLSKSTVTDPLNGAPSEFHMYIPIPTTKNPVPNVQFWVGNGAGRVLIRFKTCQDLASTLRTLADIVTSNHALDEFQHAEDMSDYV